MDAVLRDLEAADYIEPAKIIAFDWEVLRLTRERRPDLRTAHLTVPRLHDTRLPDGSSPWTDGFDPRDHGGSELAAIKAHGGDEWSPHQMDITPERVAEARRLGLRVGPWGLSEGRRHPPHGRARRLQHHRLRRRLGFLNRRQGRPLPA